LHEQLEAWVSGVFAFPVEVRNLTVLNGHAGLTYAFDVAHRSGDVVESLVLRLAPAGVRRRGSSDVLHQVLPLQLLARVNFPVATARFWGEDPRWFGVPFLVVRRMRGEPFDIERGKAPRRQDFLTSVRLLGEFHRAIDIEELRGWDEVRSFEQEIRSWDRALDKLSSASWHSLAVKCRAELLSAARFTPAVGLCHGDYQFSNLLFDEGELSAVLDWELAGLGPQIADLGWFMVINDQRSWAHKVGLDDRPSDAELRATYEESAGLPVNPDQLTFSCALAAYRFAVIAGLNLQLHRTGRRIDNHWEHLEPSIPRLLDLSLDHLSMRRE